MTFSPDTVYKSLESEYGPQGWWPIVDVESGKSVYSRRTVLKDDEIFEICAGAILTQSVAWKNAEKAIFNLKSSSLLSPETIVESPLELLAERIRPSGYFNQKAIKLKNFAIWLSSNGFTYETLSGMDTDNFRKGLLSVKGIGPETADSMLLYAFSRIIFVIDAYTKRLFGRLGLADESAGYNELQMMFHKSFTGGLKEYNEYHALIVNHCKLHCRKKPECKGCVLARSCRFCHLKKS